MASATEIDRVRTLTVVRRSLEVRWGWRWIFGGTLTAVGVIAVVNGGPVPIAIGAVSGVLGLALFALPRFAPEHVHGKLLAAARDRLEGDGEVTLAGIAGEIGASIISPYSRVPCLAYWARQVSADPEDETRDAGMDAEQRSAVRDFALVIGDERIRVITAHAELVFDRACAKVVDGAGTSSRREEIVLRPGDRVVVRGTLVRQSDAPYRATAELSGRVTVVLDARR